MLHMLLMFWFTQYCSTMQKIFQMKETPMHEWVCPNCDWYCFNIYLVSETNILKSSVAQNWPSASKWFTKLYFEWLLALRHFMNCQSQLIKNQFNSFTSVPKGLILSPSMDTKMAKRLSYAALLWLKWNVA